MGRICMIPVELEEEMMDVIHCEDAEAVRKNFLEFVELLAEAKKTNHYHMIEADPTCMAMMLAEVSARPDAPKTYREWRKWLLEEYRCDT